MRSRTMSDESSEDETLNRVDEIAAKVERMSDGVDDLAFIAGQLQRVLAECDGLREDMGVVKAALLRFERTTAALLQEARAIRADMTRMNDGAVIYVRAVTAIRA